MKRLYLSILCTILVLIENINTSRAESKYSHNVYFNIGISTFGFSFDLDYYFNNFIGIKADYNFFPYGIARLPGGIISDFVFDSLGGQTYRAVSGYDSEMYNVVYQAWGISLAIKPFKGPWYIAVGFKDTYMYGTITTTAYYTGYKPGNDPSLYLTDENEGIISSLQMYDSKMTGVQAITKVEISKGIKPYIGMGWDFTPRKFLTITLELGAIMTIEKWRVTEQYIDYSNKRTLTDILSKKSGVENETYNDYINVRFPNDMKKGKEETNKRIPNWLRFVPLLKVACGLTFNVRDFFE